MASDEFAPSLLVLSKDRMVPEPSSGNRTRPMSGPHSVLAVVLAEALGAVGALRSRRGHGGARLGRAGQPPGFRALLARGTGDVVGSRRTFPGKDEQEARHQHDHPEEFQKPLPSLKRSAETGADRTGSTHGDPEGA